jgi:hypothetical protein
MPLSLSDEEKDLLLALAQPIDQRLRPEFLAAVAAELEADGQAGAVGIGSVHRDGARGSTPLFRPAAAAERGQNGARLEGEVQSWNTTGRPRLSLVERSGFGASWPALLPQRKHRSGWPGFS